MLTGDVHTVTEITHNFMRRGHKSMNDVGEKNGLRKKWFIMVASVAVARITTALST